jgi:hypothetical protein
MSDKPAPDAKDEQQRKLIAQMADEIERIRREDWKAPEGVDLVSPDIMPVPKPIPVPAKYTRRKT